MITIFLALLVVPGIITLGSLIVVYHWMIGRPLIWPGDLGAERRGRGVAREALAELAAGGADETTRSFARQAFEASSLSGDPALAETLRGPG